MRLPRGQKYVEDIKKLVSLKVKDPKAYESFKKTIMKEYGISQRTVYRDMKDKVPGLRKVRKDSGKFKSKIPLKTKLIISEVLMSGNTKKDAIKIAEKLTGQKVSKRAAARTKPVDVEKTNFDKDIKPFLEKICGYDLMGPKAGIKLKLRDLPFTVNKEDLSDIILILTNAFNRSNDSSGLPLDKNELFRKKIFQLLEYNMKLAEASSDLKSLESITRMYNSIQEEHELGSDFEIVYRICAALRPNISRQEVISMIKQHSNTNNNS
jgi:hypothetical protein